MYPVDGNDPTRAIPVAAPRKQGRPAIAVLSWLSAAAFVLSSVLPLVSGADGAPAGAPGGGSGFPV